MLVAAVAAILERDLETLAREVKAYPDEAALWHLPEGITNSTGTLVLHLTGNVQHFLGARLGDTGYVRDRPAEFAARGIPRATLLRRIEASLGSVRAAAGKVSSEMLERDYPEVVGGVRVATGEYLVHLVAHFAYHLGQVDYHRRLVTRNPRGLEAVRAAELFTARPAAD